MCLCTCIRRIETLLTTCPCPRLCDLVRAHRVRARTPSSPSAHLCNAQERVEELLRKRAAASPPRTQLTQPVAPRLGPDPEKAEWQCAAQIEPNPNPTSCLGSHGDTLDLAR